MKQFIIQFINNSIKFIYEAIYLLFLIALLSMPISYILFKALNTILPIVSFSWLQARSITFWQTDYIVDGIFMVGFAYSFYIRSVNKFLDK